MKRYPGLGVAVRVAVVFSRYGLELPVTTPFDDNEIVTV
jgi:hypothetical protein